MSGTNGNIVQPPAPEAAAELRAAALIEERQQVSELRAASTALIQRMQFAQQHGLSFKDKRDLNIVLGYNPTLTAKDYGARYARGGIAGRIVDVYPNATWRGEVDVIEDENPKVFTVFEKAWADLDRKHQIQGKLLRVDKLSLLSTYAILLIGASGDLKTELPRGNPKTGIRYLNPYAGGGGPSQAGQNFGNRSSAYDADVSVYELEDDPDSERFGLARFYSLRRFAAATVDATPRLVHWSRVIHVAENVLWDEIYGLPALERIWNLLDDLDKITGGGAEAFWLRANQGLHLDIDKDMALPDAENAVKALKEQAEEYKHQLTRWLRTRGVSVTPLGSDVANFVGPADAVLTQIAGAKGIPKRILTGSEMGELASSQDRDNWKDQINGRQTSYAGPYIVRQLVNRLIQYGYLPLPLKGADEYQVIWPNLQVLTEAEKAAGAKQWSEVNATQGEIVFPNDEIRSHWYGFEPLTDEQKKMPEPPAAPAPQEAKPVVEDVLVDDKLPDTPETRELLSILEAAISVGNTEVIDEIMGFKRA